MDVYNLTNANTIFDVSTGTGQTHVRAGGDPSADRPDCHVPVADPACSDHESSGST